jgi:hypothetical protein
MEHAKMRRSLRPSPVLAALVTVAATVFGDCEKDSQFNAVTQNLWLPRG